jgi:hypothetical protein
MSMKEINAQAAFVAAIEASQDSIDEDCDPDELAQYMGEQMVAALRELYGVGDEAHIINDLEFFDVMSALVDSVRWEYQQLVDRAYTIMEDQAPRLDQGSIPVMWSPTVKAAINQAVETEEAVIRLVAVIGPNPGLHEAAFDEVARRADLFDSQLHAAQSVFDDVTTGRLRWAGLAENNPEE